MSNPVLSIPNLAIAVQLLVWSVSWLTAAILGLWRTRADYWRTFWLVSGVWCTVNSSLALAGLVGPLSSTEALRGVLLINAGLDLLYIAAGIFLLSRPGATARGAGLAVVIQGAFLLLFDTGHAWHLSPP